MQLYAPAKINLSLKIKGRRADGFHEIETLMVPITLGDQVTIETGEDGGGIDFACNDSSIPIGKDNLVVKAAELFQQATANAVGLRIVLEKRIPHGAGLGGGSSDAATTLLGLNKLLGANLGQEELIRLGAKIGSDVPFFIAGGAAICRGRGELIEPTVLPRRFELLLLKPDFGVPTPWAYGRRKESKELHEIPYRAQEFAEMSFANDLERPVFEKFVFLGELKKWLCEQPEVGVALMSGSGSTVFVVLKQDSAGGELVSRVREQMDPEIWSYLCRTAM
jgi:4-diphosphocytidyl-2-C-methyl-D-erythritol kinase